MKLVQKLAVVMTAAMAISAVPVVTMAASTNRVVSGAQVVAKDDVTTAQISIDFKDFQPGEEEFFVELTGAEYNVDVNKGGLVKGKTYYFADYEFTVTDDKIAKVEVNKDFDAKNNKLVVNLPIVAKDAGQIKAKLNANGGQSSITEGEYVIANAAEKTASLTVATGDDVKSFYDEGELSEITLRESSVGAFNKDGLTLEIELDDTDFEFNEQQKIEIEAKYGATGKVPYTFVKDKDDASRAYITIQPGALPKGTSLITLKINKIGVFTDEKDPDLGDLKATIKSTDKYGIKGELDKDYEDVVVAKIADYGLTIEMKDKKAVDVVAGRQEEVKFNVKENVNDVFVDGRTVELTLKDSDGDTDDQFFIVKRDELNNLKKAIISDNDKYVSKVEPIYFDKDADVNHKDADDEVFYNKGVVRLKGFKITLTEITLTGTKKLEKEDFEVKAQVYVPVSEKATKSVDVVGEFRGEKVQGATLVNIINPFDVKAEATTVKVGLQDQELTPITITETDKERFQKGDLYVGVERNDKAVKGATVEEIGNLTVTGDLKRVDFDEVKYANAAKINLKRQSKSASTLTIDKALITIDRTVPEGKYDLVLSGSAIDKYDGKVVVKDYLNIGTPNTQDLAANGLAKGEAKFVIGEAKYTFNGVEYAMDAPSFIQDPGYTMVPVRYVAQAFGVKAQNILFGKGTVTLLAGERTIQFTNGSAEAIVNGAKVTLATKTVIKDGRTYLPIGELAKILGISSSWDNTTKAATFVNK